MTDAITIQNPRNRGGSTGHVLAKRSVTFTEIRKQAACSQNFAQPDPIALAVRGLISKIETDDLLSYFFRSDAAMGLTSYGDEELGYAIQDLKDERKIGNAELVKLTIRDRPKYA